MTRLEPRHKKALQAAYKAASATDHLQARYLREVMNKLGVSVTGWSAIAPHRPLRARRPPVSPFMKPMKLSSQLQAVCGNKMLPRTEIVARLWTYIKKNKLQDEVNRRMVNCDAKLKPIFGKMQVSIFEMAGLIGKHVS